MEEQKKIPELRFPDFEEECQIKNEGLFSAEIQTDMV